MKTTLIRTSEIPKIAEAVKHLVNRYGHLDEIPLSEAAAEGVNPDDAEKCEALLTSEGMPEEPARAVAKWLRLIGEFSE